MRVVFFALLGGAALIVGGWPAAIPAVLGLLIGTLALAVASVRGERFAHTFVVVDWLLLGCTVAVGGGVHSWLLVLVPFLAATYLAVSPRQEAAYLLAPSLVLLVVLAIADPTLGGSKLLGAGLVLALITAGGVAGRRLGLARTRRRQAPRIDALTGFATAARLRSVAATRLATAAANNTPLSLVYLCLPQLDECRASLGAEDANELVRAAAEGIDGWLRQGDTAFRLAPDAFALLLPGRTPDDARQLASRMADDAGVSVIAGWRPLLTFGCAAFPAAASVDQLLTAAKAEAQPTTSMESPALPTELAAAN